ncbi:hypothetical protein M3Y97_00729700 [Aphelenchoides bicaudatus]|nr:hypothetical protein M3Y97_00729700 [Aphelenchoides bicaudatus]
MKFLLLTVLLPLLAYSAVVPNKVAQPAKNTREALSKTLIESLRKSVAEKLVKQRAEAIQKMNFSEVKKLQFQTALIAKAKAQKPGLHFLCKPCKTVFDDVKEELENVEQITADILKPLIDQACQKYTGKIPFIEKACEEIGETAIDDLVDWLEKEEEGLDSARVCTYLHLC